MGTLYNISLFLHSWNRWIILITGVMLIIWLISSLSLNKPFTSPLRRFALTFIASLHIQLLIGLLLYFFFSPLTQAAFNDFGNAMKNSGLRFWAIEHTLLNVIAIILAQIGYSKSKRKQTDRSKIKVLLTFTIIAIVLILLVIPMGIMGVERPWFRV